MKRCHKGFARVDFVVTFLCAAFLIMTMGAVGNRGRRRAQQLVCASQLAKWGKAIFMQSADNGEEVMSIVRRWGEIPFPNYMAALPLRLYDPEWWIDGMRYGEFSIYLIDPYLDIISDDFESTGQATRLLTCPSTNSDFMVNWNWFNWDDFCNPSYGEYFIETSYSYWGRADLLEDYECSPNAKRDLTRRTFSADGLLMSDILNIDSGWGGFRYNHGVDGWCWTMSWIADIWTPGRQKFDGEQDATGRSQLFGDGRVQWRPISLEFEDNLPSEISQLGGVGFEENEWNGPGSGFISSGGWDFSYY